MRTCAPARFLAAQRRTNRIGSVLHSSGVIPSRRMPARAPWSRWRAYLAPLWLFLVTVQQPLCGQRGRQWSQVRTLPRISHLRVLKLTRRGCTKGVGLACHLDSTTSTTAAAIGMIPVSHAGGLRLTAEQLSCTSPERSNCTCIMMLLLGNVNALMASRPLRDHKRQWLLARPTSATAPASNC